LIGLVLRQSLRLAVIGVGIGLLLALGVSRLFASVVANLDTFNALGYAGGVTLVLLTCLVAAYIPSRRAAAVDPVEALRADS
jgi:putative ABC transport system permease protein